MVDACIAENHFYLAMAVVRERNIVGADAFAKPSVERSRFNAHIAKKSGCRLRKQSIAERRAEKRLVDLARRETVRDAGGSIRPRGGKQSFVLHVAIAEERCGYATTAGNGFRNDCT
jgi:hypothetical protein